MICEVCGCTDVNACYDESTGQVCGWADEDLCTFCAAGGEEEEVPDLGPCCGCEIASPGVRNIVMLEKKASIAGTGWGCVVCGLSFDGAVAVLCDAWLWLWEHEQRPIRYACNGYPASGERVPVEELVGEHHHRDELHQEG
jgi:hypothetical protein